MSTDPQIHNAVARMKVILPTKGMKTGSIAHDKAAQQLCPKDNVVLLKNIAELLEHASKEACLRSSAFLDRCPRWDTYLIATLAPSSLIHRNIHIP